MNHNKSIIFLIILVLSIPYTYGGCVLVFTSGDIEREKDPEDSETPTVFAGRTTQAVIDSTNANDLSGGAFAGGITRIEAASAGFNQDSTATQIGAFRPLRFPLVLQDSLQKVEKSSTAVGPFTPAVETKSGTLQGGCGGKLSYSIDFIDESRAFDGRFSFENYCDHGITISGETDINGAYGVDSGDFTTAHFSFADLADGDITLDGEISIDFLHPPITAILSAYSKDIESGQVYWIKDYSMNITEFAGYIEIELFGTFYHPDYGFVNLTTAEPFIVHHEDDWPTSGLLVIQGEKNTQAELSALDQLNCSVAADTDGDGVFDWDSGILNWTER
ncbi:MAG: hypothetical protein MUO88_24995 [Desulfobacterales bacterium]|nr:hypothetical protein [Desulfobacterales bacterium]